MRLKSRCVRGWWSRGWNLALPHPATGWTDAQTLPQLGCMSIGGSSQPFLTHRWTILSRGTSNPKTHLLLMNRLLQCVRILSRVWVVLSILGSCSIWGPSPPQDVHVVLWLQRILGLTVCSTLNVTKSPVISKGTCSAARAAGEDGDLKYQQIKCLRPPEPAQKPSWPKTESAPQPLFDQSYFWNWNSQVGREAESR